MSQSIKTRVGAMSVKRDSKELRKLIEAVLVDLGALRTPAAANVTDVAALASAVDTLAAKLNSDAGVTDANYSVANAAAVTASAPAALTLTS